MANVEKKQNYTPVIVVMFALFFMIAFVTNLAGSMGVIVTNQFGASKALSQLGTLANFIAYACMAEEWCGSYLRSHGLDIRIIRSYTKKSSPEKQSALPAGEDIDRLLSVFYQDRDIYS